MTRGFWLEGEVCDVAGTEDETNGTNLLVLETEVFWDETEDKNYDSIEIKLQNSSCLRILRDQCF